MVKISSQFFEFLKSVDEKEDDFVLAAAAYLVVRTALLHGTDVHVHGSSLSGATELMRDRARLDGLDV